MNSEIARIPARPCLLRKCSRVDGHRENSADTEGFSEGQSGQQLSPLIACLPMMWKLLMGIMGEKL